MKSKKTFFVALTMFGPKIILAYCIQSGQACLRSTSVVVFFAANSPSKNLGPGYEFFFQAKLSEIQTHLPNTNCRYWFGNWKIKIWYLTKASLLFTFHVKVLFVDLICPLRATSAHIFPGSCAATHRVHKNQTHGCLHFTS